MAFEIVAEPRDQFEGRFAHSAQPAVEPKGPEAKRGMQVFLSQPCVLCHIIDGTTAMGQVAPNLTRGVPSGRTLAAGTVPNMRGFMGGVRKDKLVRSKLACGKRAARGTVAAMSAWLIPALYQASI